jgi:hypothetical protein
MTKAPPPSLSHRPPHPETDSVGAVPLLYSILVQYDAWLRRKALIWATGARNTTHKNTYNTGAGLSYSGSGVCPTNLRISAGSSRMKTTKLPYFIEASRKSIFRSQTYFLLSFSPPAVRTTRANTNPYDTKANAAG